MSPDTALTLTVVCNILLAVEWVVVAVDRYPLQDIGLPGIAAVAVACLGLMTVVILSPWPALNLANVPVLALTCVFLGRWYSGSSGD